MVSDRRPDRHLVLYDPAEARHLDHLVAHEAGHIRHFANTPTDERTVPVLTPEARRTAIVQPWPELANLLAHGFPDQALLETLNLWLSGTIAQLADTPADIEIETELWQHRPALQRSQRAPLEAQVTTLHQVLRPAVRAVTPPSIWLASNAMNYALIKSVCRLMGEPWMVRPFRGTAAASIGDELLAMLTFPLPDDVPGTRAVSDRWAARLGFDYLPRWTPLSGLPPGSRFGLE